MDTQGKTILVTGATGRQGGAVARHLIGDGWSVRALTRDPDSPAARKISSMGAEVVAGDMDDLPTLPPALKSAYGVFAVQNPWEAGIEAEVRQGKQLAEAARAAGVAHFVYSSVGGAERATGIPHFESKWKIEQHIEWLGVPATVLRPASFMENFKGERRPERRAGTLTLSMALSPEKPLQMIAVDDIGAFAALAFGRPEQFLGQGIELAGDELGMAVVADLLGDAAGEPVRYQPVPLEQLRSSSPDLAAMFEWLETRGYRADIPALRDLHPGLKSFRDWLAENSLAGPAE